jgi:NADPH-dependent curcumin reductase CurA
VGGAVTEAVAKQLNSGSRVPICGYISNYNAPKIAETRTPFDILGELADPTQYGFFLVYDFFEDYAEANEKLTRWVADGSIKYRETIVDGLENAPGRGVMLAAGGLLLVGLVQLRRRGR